MKISELFILKSQIYQKNIQRVLLNFEGNILTINIYKKIYYHFTDQFNVEVYNAIIEFQHKYHNLFYYE
jgi:hypothetical protein